VCWSPTITPITLVWLHPADIAMLQQQRQELSLGLQRRLERLTANLNAAGAPTSEIIALRTSTGSLMPSAPLAPDRELTDGELTDVPGRQLRALWTPGHSPGHTCFYLEPERRLLSGDHLLPGITPHVALFDGNDGDPLADFLGSLERLSELDVVEVLPAHEHRFHAAGARAQQIVEHHHARLREVERGLSATRATLWELAQRMHWNRPWEDMTVMSHRMALNEAAAHLRYLERRQRVRVTGPDWPIRYQLVAS
jgi:glyoxylase-like metal-dependent hydrolase (beta-lactamase superfamily II)